MSHRLSIAFFILAIIATTTAQDPSILCEYFNYSVNGTDTYACHLRVNNPDGVEFETIPGDHLNTNTNSDVLSLIAFTGSTSIIPQVICTQFENLQILDLSFLFISSITSASFSNCINITWLRLYFNRVTSIPADTFANNQQLTHVDLDNLGLTSIPETLFAPLVNLEYLELANNPIASIPVDLFSGLSNLHTLYLSNVQLTEFDERIFEPLVSLSYLTLFNNRLTSLPEHAFDNLQGLTILDIGNNNFGDDLPDFVFRNLTSLVTLSMSQIGVRQLNPTWFATLRNLHQLSLTFNNIEELPHGVFGSLVNIERIGMWNNRVKTLERESFGDLRTLRYLDVDANVINSMDRRFFNDAENLQSLYFSNNLCASGYFFSFAQNRENFLGRLGRCFRNFGFTVDTDTETDQPYQFFSAPNPGIQLRVTSEQTVHIALTPFNFPWTPMLEIFIGAANNTRSIIRRNQETDVVVIPTPNILRNDQLNGFRIIWANQVILVLRETDEFPFMAYTMQDFYNVNFYGIQSMTRATWSIQPIDREEIQPTDGSN